MEGPKRVTGFMPLAKWVVGETPGLTAKEVYDRVVQLSKDERIEISAASNPQASLVATLSKVHQDFGMERRRGRDGKYRFYQMNHQASDDLGRYPEARLTAGNQPPAVERNPTEDCLPVGNTGDQRDEAVSHSTQTFLVEGSCCLRLSEEERKKIRALVDLDRYRDEHQAHSDLVKLGLEAVLSRLLL